MATYSVNKKLRPSVTVASNVDIFELKGVARVDATSTGKTLAEAKDLAVPDQAQLLALAPGEVLASAVRSSLLVEDESVIAQDLDAYIAEKIAAGVAAPKLTFLASYVPALKVGASVETVTFAVLETQVSFAKAGGATHRLVAAAESYTKVTKE